jgi:glycosyltransferase involved in cell wall biosynthesis
MKIRLFPDGGIHSAYLDLVRSPPNGVEFVGNFRYDYATFYQISHKGAMIKILDGLNLPYVIPMSSEIPIHSCQKLLITNANYVVDIEHGNPFMGENAVFKNEYLMFKAITSNLIEMKNCKYIMPWTEKAKEAFMRNFSFVGRDLLKEKTIVVRPCVIQRDIHGGKFDKFTFIFVCGGSFNEKGGIAVLEAFRVFSSDHDCSLIVVGTIPDIVYAKYKDMRGLITWVKLPREEMIRVISKSHCAILPSYADTYGMFLMEAKSFGVPAIVIDSFALSEVVTHKKTGFVVDQDMTIPIRFDKYGCKTIGRADFLSKFIGYVPSAKHIDDLSGAMKYMLSASQSMAGDCIEEISSGRFSIVERDKVLKDVYGALGD